MSNAESGFIFIQKLYCSFSVLDLLKIYSLPVKFLSGALPTFGVGGLDGCVMAHWIWNCSVLWVANFLNTSSTEKCTMGIGNSCPNANLSSKRSLVIEFNRSICSISRGWMFQHYCLLSGIIWRFFFFSLRECTYIFSLKGPRCLVKFTTD